MDRQDATKVMNPSDATIRPNEPQLFELIHSWVATSRGAELQLGSDVSEVVSSAIALRREIASGRLVRLDLENQIDIADLLHALCQLLMDDCQESPQSVLDEASFTVEILKGSLWIEDDLGEREGLLCKAMFVAWRAARLLDLSRAAQLWEAEYAEV